MASLRTAFRRAGAILRLVRIIEFPRYRLEYCRLSPFMRVCCCGGPLPGAGIRRSRANGCRGMSAASGRIEFDSGLLASISHLLRGYGRFPLVACGRLLAFVAIPFGLFAAAPVRHSERMNWQDGLILLWILTPVLFGKIGGSERPGESGLHVPVIPDRVGSWSFSSSATE